MKLMTSEELKIVLEKHEKWLKGEKDGERAILSGADLSEADLREADLSGADLSEADLREADLSEADLREAGLSGANLREADLREADLREADLIGANLREADLREADLSGANLREADLRNVRGLFLPFACPDSGSFVGWKKCRGNVIVKLLIHDDAKRSSATERKCRCSSATVLALENIDGTPANVDCAYSKRDSSFEYRAGEIVSVDNFDENRWNECAPGIHFFVTREEAVKY